MTLKLLLVPRQVASRHYRPVDENWDGAWYTTLMKVVFDVPASMKCFTWVMWYRSYGESGTAVLGRFLILRRRLPQYMDLPSVHFGSQLASHAILRLCLLVGSFAFSREVSGDLRCPLLSPVPSVWPCIFVPPAQLQLALQGLVEARGASNVRRLGNSPNASDEGTCTSSPIVSFLVFIAKASSS